MAHLIEIPLDGFPIVTLSAMGVRNDYALENHIYGFISIIGSLLYCIIEEYGWRGYLKDELASLNEWKQSLLIGSMWYVWHLSFLTNASLDGNFFFWAILIFGSWGIGRVAEQTKSILASACFHLIVQIMMFNSLIRNGINGTEKIIIMVVCITLWMAILTKWKKQPAESLTQKMKD